MTRMTLIVLAAVVLAAGLLSGSAPQAPFDFSAHTSRVTTQQFNQWMTELSNWGRWGDDDELGTLNLITPEKVTQAAALVQTGTRVSLSLELSRRAPEPVPEPRPINIGGALTNLFLIEGDALYERQEIEYHGGAISHFDALCHVAYKGKVYNGYDFADVADENGCSKLAVTTAQDGIVTRGVLLDLPDTRVQPEDVEAWEKRTGITISSGDALLLRTRTRGSAGLGFMAAGYDPSLIPFFKQRDIALLGADVPQEGGHIPDVFIPIHTFTIVALGMNLLDNLDLHDLADTAERLNRWEFMLVVQPLRVENGGGSAVNAVAVF